MCLKTQVRLCRFVCGRASGMRAGNRDQQEILISCSFHHFQKLLKQGAAQPCSTICSSETALYLCHFNFFLLLLTWRTNSFSVPCCQSVPAAQLLTPVVPDAQFNQWHEIILFSPKPERTAQCMWSAPKTVVRWIFVHLPPSLATSIIKSSLNMLRVHTHTYVHPVKEESLITDSRTQYVSGRRWATCWAAAALRLSALASRLDLCQNAAPAVTTHLAV